MTDLDAAADGMAFPDDGSMESKSLRWNRVNAVLDCGQRCRHREKISEWYAACGNRGRRHMAKLVVHFDVVLSRYIMCQPIAVENQFSALLDVRLNRESKMEKKLSDVIASKLC